MAASAVPLRSRRSVFSAPIPTFYPPARDVARAVFGDAPPAVASRLPPLTTSRPPMAAQTILPEERHPGSVRVGDHPAGAGGRFSQRRVCGAGETAMRAHFHGTAFHGMYPALVEEADMGFDFRQRDVTLEMSFQ